MAPEGAARVAAPTSDEMVASAMRNDPRRLTRRIEVGQRLRELRRTRGLTQGELARAARLGQATLSNYEGGRRDILLGMAERVAEALDVTFGFLLDVPHIWVIRDPELARAVRILADSEELLTSIVGPRPPPPPRPPRAAKARPDAEGEATDGEAEPTAEAETPEDKGDAPDPESEAPEGQADATNGEAEPTAEGVAPDAQPDATNGAAEPPSGEAEDSDGEADTTDGADEPTEAGPGDAEAEQVADGSGERGAAAETPDAGAEA